MVFTFGQLTSSGKLARDLGTVDVSADSDVGRVDTGGGDSVGKTSLLSGDHAHSVCHGGGGHNMGGGWGGHNSGVSGVPESGVSESESGVSVSKSGISESVVEEGGISLSISLTLADVVVSGYESEVSGAGNGHVSGVHAGSGFDSGVSVSEVSGIAESQSRVSVSESSVEEGGVGLSVSLALADVVSDDSGGAGNGHVSGVHAGGGFESGVSVSKVSGVAESQSGVSVSESSVSKVVSTVQKGGVGLSHGGGHKGCNHEEFHFVF